jgi:hypothetical protein
MIRERDLSIEIFSHCGITAVRVTHEPSGLTGHGVLEFPSSDRVAARNVAIKELIRRMREYDIEPVMCADLYTGLHDTFRSIAGERP